MFSYELRGPRPDTFHLQIILVGRETKRWRFFCGVRFTVLVDFVVISGQGHVSGINNGVEKGREGRLIGRCEKSRPSETE